MGFAGKYSCYSFTMASIRQNAPALSGVYALSNANGWLFVGQSADVQSALWKHLREGGTPPRQARPTGFSFELCEVGARNQRLTRLIRDLSPSCNHSTSPKA